MGRAPTGRDVTRRGDVTTRTGYRRLFVTEIAINAIFSAAFAGVFTWLMFGFGPVQTPAEHHRLVVDCFPQTFMTTLFSYFVPGLSVRIRLRNGTIAPMPSAFAALNRIPFVAQIFMAALVSTLTVGALAGGMARLCIGLSLSSGALMTVKITYGIALSVGISIIALLAALAPPKPSCSP